MIFLKRFMMAVSLSIPLIAVADLKDEYIQAISLAQNEIKRAELLLDNKFLECKKKQINNPLMVKDSLPDIPKKKLNNAIFYLSSVFHLKCISNEQADLVYKWHIAKQLIQRATNEGVDLGSNPLAKRISNKNIIVSFPIIALAEVKYLKLPEKTRNQLEAIKELRPPYNTKPLVKLFIDQ